MTTFERLVLWVTMLLALLAAAWIGVVLFGGTKLSVACRYLVPVTGHPNVLTRSDKPKPKRVP